MYACEGDNVLVGFQLLDVLRSISYVTCFGVRGCQYLYMHACMIFCLARYIHIYVKIYENVSAFFACVRV